MDSMIKKHSSFILLLSIIAGLYFYSQVMIKIMDDRIEKKNRKLESFIDTNIQPPENLTNKLESIKAYKPKKITNPTAEVDYSPLKTCAIDLVATENYKLKVKKKSEKNISSIKQKIEDSKKSEIEKYYNNIPQDNYVGLYQDMYQEYLQKNRKESFPFLSSNNETLEQNYTHFEDLDKPPEFLDKGTATNIKSKNYYKINQAIKRSKNKYDPLPSRKKRHPKFKCQRKYEVCDTSHVPLEN